MAAVALISTMLVACVSDASPSPSSVATSRPPTIAPSASVVTSPTGSAAATPTPTPALTLEPPPRQDARQVRFEVTPNVADEVGTVGKITVRVTNLTKQRIDEIVLRWPTALGATLFVAPFEPSAGRAREGVPLVVPWTKWVEGPGEHGEPAGTTSLGWGPLLPGATLSIPLVVTRNAAGAVSFDLQFLSGVPGGGDVPPDGDQLLSVEGGGPATTRVDVP
jgi:hypothetical protein